MTDLQQPSADNLRALLTKAGLSQRAAARELGIEDRAMRYWCAGKEPVPRMVILALERLIELEIETND